MNEVNNGWITAMDIMSVKMILPTGKIKIKVPRTRNGEFSTEVFEKYARCDKALLLSMLEMVVNGVSTRKVTKIVEELCGQSVSKSMVSNLTQTLDPIVNQWANRSLNVMYYRYIYVDAMYIKVREHDKVVSKEDNHVDLSTTNVLERLNSEIRRREKVIRIFPNHQSAFRLIGAVLMDQDDVLDLGNRRFLHDSK